MRINTALCLLGFVSAGAMLWAEPDENRFLRLRRLKCEGVSINKDCAEGRELALEKQKITLAERDYLERVNSIPVFGRDRMAIGRCICKDPAINRFKFFIPKLCNPGTGKRRHKNSLNRDNYLKSAPEPFAIFEGDRFLGEGKITKLEYDYLAEKRLIPILDNEGHATGVCTYLR
jgi:hypothetical protein